MEHSPHYPPASHYVTIGGARWPALPAPAPASQAPPVRDAPPPVTWHIVPQHSPHYPPASHYVTIGGARQR